MNRSEQLEIDRILSEIADEGTSRELIERLGGLLYDRPDMQQYYSQVIELHMLLTYELGLSLQSLQPVIPKSAWQATPKHIDERADRRDLLDRLSRDASICGDDTAHRRRWFWFTVATAVALAIVGVGYGIWLSGDAPWWHDAFELAADDTRQDTFNGPTAIDSDSLVIRDARTMKVFSRLTRTSLLTSLQLPNCLSGDAQEITLCSGVAWMKRSPGDLERGYLVALPPGQLMDLYVDTDADDQNALAVVEIDALGRMTGGTISFSNVVEGEGDTANRRAGCIGNYSVFNDSSFTKYYLFAGSHVLPKQSVDESWYQSDYQVQHESRDLIVIGWDDSGYADVPQPNYGDFTPDLDYNDIRAILRFSRPGETRKSTSTGVHYSPQPDANLPMAEESETGYLFDVKPGEQLVVMISASARLPNSIRVIERPSRHTLWQLDGVPPGSPMSPDLNRGIYIIRNYGDTVRQYQLFARYKAVGKTGKYAWRATPYKVLAEGDGSVTVGYEDSLSVPKNIDWNDIRVHARWFSD